MPTPSSLLDLVRTLPKTTIEAGLRPAEFDAIEFLFKFRFPEDLRDLLSAGLPTGPRWPDWRSAAAGTAAGVESIRGRLDWPLQGALFDVENNSFWDPQWGDRPADVASAKFVATAAVRAAPPLIPVYVHRFMPAEPLTPGNPVFSVYQMDIIVYGVDLATYLQNESRSWTASSSEARDIRCWTRWMNQEWQEW